MTQSTQFVVYVVIYSRTL